jgi:diguanylate cyclase (GGDEF)-like protein
MLGLLSADPGAWSWSLAFPGGVFPTHLAAPLVVWALLAAAILPGSSELVRKARERISRECSEAYLVVGHDGAIADFNPAGATLLERTPLTTGQPVSAILPDVAGPALAACARGEPWLGSVTCPGGSTLAASVTSICDARGNPLGALVVMRPSTSQESKASAPASGEDNFRKAFEANPFPLTITRTATSEILLANHAALDFCEIPADELATTYLTDFYANPGQRARLISALKACGMVNDMLIAFRTRGGKTRWAVVNAFPFDFNGEPCLLSGLADMTDRKRAEDALAQRARELTALHETSLIVSSQSETSTLMTTVVERTTELLGATGGGIYLLQTDQQTLALTAGSTLPLGWAGLVVALGSGIAGIAALKGAAQVVENYHEWAGKAGELSDGFAGRVLATPLKFRDRVMGVLVIAGAVPGPFTSDELQLVQLFAEQASIALENARLYSEVQRLAVIDELTGFHNRRGLFAYGEREVRRSARYSRPLSAIMLDLDHFKAVNDRYGHPAGDEVLRRVAECIRARARAVDIAGRYGGEEVVLLLPETGLSGAVLIAERLRLAIADTTIETAGHSITVTASFGVATLSASTPDLGALLDQADRALYDAKESGRNRVCSAG